MIGNPSPLMPTFARVAGVRAGSTSPPIALMARSMSARGSSARAARREQEDSSTTDRRQRRMIPSRTGEQLRIEVVEILCPGHGHLAEDVVALDDGDFRRQLQAAHIQ